MQPKRIFYPNHGGLVDLACAVVKMAMFDLRTGRRYVRDEMDPEQWLRHAGMWHLAEQALATDDNR